MKPEILQSIQKEWWTSKYGRQGLPQSSKGFSLVEVILACSLFALLVTAFIGAYLYGEESSMLAGNRARAVMLAEEGLEATRNIRDASFSNITDGTHGLGISANQWVFSGVSDSTDIFTREVVVSSIDADRKNVISNVTWQQNGQRSGLVSLVTEFTNFMALGIGDWSNPFVEDTINVGGNQNGSKIQTVGNYAYMIRTDGTPDFLVIDVTNPASAVTVGTLSLTGVPQNIFVSGNYAYVANNSDTQELQIIDISTPSAPSVVGIYDDTGVEDTLGVYVSGNYAYLAMNTGNDFVIVDVATPATPTFVGGLVLDGAPSEVVVSGNYAYLSSNSNTQELQVVNITTPATPTLVGSLNLPTNTNATTLAYSGSTLYMGQGTNFRIVNIADITPPVVPVLLGTLITSGNTNDIALDTGNSGAYAYIANTSNTAEFQVIDVSTPATPTLLGSEDTTGNDDMLGMSYNSTLDRAFGASSSNALEFFVFSPI